MRHLVPLGERISVDGGMARNPYFLSFLATALGKTVLVPSSVNLTALGTARMAMIGAGAQELPALPPPAHFIAPTGGFGAEASTRFAEAVTRARAWRRS
jgi:glycerol kinase